MARARATDFATCPVSQLGFARVSSHPLLGYSMSPDQAFGVLRRFLADSRHRFVSDDLSCADRIVRTDLMGGANQVTDHYLVALARHHRLSLATFDEAWQMPSAANPVWSTWCGEPRFPKIASVALRAHFNVDTPGLGRLR